MTASGNRDPEKARARHRRYNLSAKGQARNQRYEEAHPERRDRLRTGFIARDASRSGPGA